MQDFKQKVAVITGAASGIGEGLAAHAAALGMCLVLADVDARKLGVVAKRLAEAGAEVTTRVTDVSDAAEVEALAQLCYDRFGRVDLLFNNAGVLLTGRAWERSLDDWRWVLGINLYGVLHGISSFVPRMLVQGEPAHIVNTASIAGLIAAPLNGPYTVSKQGVVALSETLHFELAAQGAALKVSVICPGPVATAIADSGQYRPEDGSAGPESAEQQAFDAVLRKTIAAGIGVDQLATQVFDAIREERFWVLPHPDFREPLKRRTESLMTGANPEFQMAQI
ncbi:MAG: SDR family NAD(P)-dependent oxidoreductase [Oceanospirillaceae bacterium]|nr:SDR family NAD(P)-dependent oxidoreductase [Oceanospirillaceae bacterium]